MISPSPSEALAVAARALHAATGEAFFRSLVEHLARQLGAEVVLAGELVDGERLRTLALWSDGPAAEVEYALAGTPCAGVVAQSTCAWSDDVQALFPADRMLVDTRARAYVGTPLLGADGQTTGILAALFRAPRPDLAAARSLLEIYSARAGGELERQRAERALRASEERLELALWGAELALWDVDIESHEGVVNERWFAQLGRRPGEVRPTADTFRAHVHPEDRPGLDDAYQAHVRGERADWDEVFRVVHKDGRVVWLHTRGRAITDARGRRRFVGVSSDVTHRKQLEADLAQAQKLEAVGRLAGGVAHDFNNLLTAILSAVELAAETLQPGDPAREDLATAKEASLRAADLTRQLLSFARRQSVQPRVVDPNALVLETERLLRRTLGEDVRLVTALASGAWRVKVDPTQLQQVLVNLAVNARDAMPQGGILTLETANVSVDPDRAHRHPGLAPGAYLRLCVSDTGAGMDAGTLARVFEPFFTTKEQGRGTGLGLATVYGIVAQAGGHVAVASEPGVGSTFKIWLPRCEEAPGRDAVPAPALRPAGGSETVLLVEDDPLVLATSARALEAHGYQVLRARSGEEALAVVRERAVDLLVSDVVMPRMPGPVLAREVARLRPGVPILFVSGYTAGAALGVVLRDRGDAFLPKPFTPGELAAKVREVIDRAAAGAGAR